MKSEFYWGLYSSFIVALIFCVIDYIQMKKLDAGIDNANTLISFRLLLFIVIYFIVGVIMLFFKNSEKFAKGILLSALILLALIAILGTDLIIIK